MSVGSITQAIVCSLLAFPFLNFIVPAQAQEIHITHCVKGCPNGAPATNDLIVREIYVLSSNDDRKFADWVAYRITNDTIGSSSSLNRTWKSDPSLDNSETLEIEDYSGANQAHRYDKGHQAPLATFAGTVYWRETNYLSNITPQKANLNQGPWKELESAVRHATDHRRELFVLTGPLYDGSEMPKLPGANEQHQVPTGYWKVISTAGGRITAFIFEQDTPRNAKYCDHRSTLDEIEARSGLDLFPEANNWPSGNLNSALGC